MWNLKSKIWSLKYEIWNLKAKTKTWNSKSEIWNLKSKIWNLKSEIQNLKSDIRKQKSEMWNLKLKLKYETWNLKSGILTPELALGPRLAIEGLPLQRCVYGWSTPSCTRGRSSQHNGIGPPRWRDRLVGSAAQPASDTAWAAFTFALASAALFESYDRLWQSCCQKELSYASLYVNPLSCLCLICVCCGASTSSLCPLCVWYVSAMCPLCVRYEYAKHEKPRRRCWQKAPCSGHKMHLLPLPPLGQGLLAHRTGPAYWVVPCISQAFSSITLFIADSS